MIVLVQPHCRNGYGKSSAACALKRPLQLDHFPAQQNRCRDLFTRSKHKLAHVMCQHLMHVLRVVGSHFKRHKRPKDALVHRTVHLLHVPNAGHLGHTGFRFVGARQELGVRRHGLDARIVQRRKWTRHVWRKKAHPHRHAQTKVHVLCTVRDPLVRAAQIGLFHVHKRGHH